MNRRTALYTFNLLLVAAASWAASPGETVIVATTASPAAPERLAAQELAGYLGRLYPRTRFAIAREAPPTGDVILIGSDSSVRGLIADADLSRPESFAVRATRRDGRELGIIAGADARGMLFGVYALLEKLGCVFTISGDTLPTPRPEPFRFEGWSLADAPLVRERLVFNWHNFLSGCSTWNLAEWEAWTAQAQKQRFNAIMVHAYGNNPMAGFTFQGKPRPVGYLSTTVKGRDWSTMHVNDVRRLFGGEVFDGPAFGADAGLVPDDRRVDAARSLMRAVFAGAAQRGMGVDLAVDVDTPSANPQELVRLLPPSARFEAAGATATVAGRSPDRIWLPDPDTPEGRAFYRAEVEGLVQAYPQVTTLVVWFRRGGTPWMDLTRADLPVTWQQEYATEVARTPEAANYWHAPGLFAVGKIVRAFQRALRECGATRVSVAAGTWGFEFLRGADRFFPAGVPLIGLDYDVIHEKPQLGTAATRVPLREVGARRPVIPIVWAHHDDGHYIGRPYTPLPDFASKLDDAKAAGFGVIHWTTRPLDLYFASLARQVWTSTKDQPLRETCRELASGWYGPANRAVMGEYLESWITGAPRFGRETGDRFIDRKLTDVAAVIAGCRTRLATIDRAATTGLTPAEREHIAYQRGLEEFIAAFHEAHAQFQESQDRLARGGIEGARRALAGCRPGEVIARFARFSSVGGITRGEQGLIVSLNTRWLSHIVRHRQALGLEPVRIKFGPTSHDKLAQSRGTFTFYFGPDHALWECLGEEETGVPTFRLPPSITPAREASAPAAWSELCCTGVETDRPLNLTMRPILARNGQGQGTHTLPPGRYRLRLLLLEPATVPPGRHVLDVQVAGGATDRVDLAERPGGANRVVELVYPVTLGSPGAVSLKVTPVSGKAMLCGAVVEPLATLPSAPPATTDSPKSREE
jgi:hypothetical protein